MVDSATTALQNKCISKQSSTIKHPLHTTATVHMKSLEFYENYITLFCLEKKQTFWQYYIY